MEDKEMLKDICESIKDSGKENKWGNYEKFYRLNRDNDNEYLKRFYKKMGYELEFEKFEKLLNKEQVKKLYYCGDKYRFVYKEGLAILDERFNIREEKELKKSEVHWFPDCKDE